MVIIPLQSFGAGDILFTMPIFQEFIQQGHQVLWGVEKQFVGLAKHFPNVAMVDKSILAVDYSRKDEYFIGNTKVIPLRFTDSILNVPYALCMLSKYAYFGKDMNEWRKLKWFRDEENEKKLFYQVLNLKDEEKYNLINRNFRQDNSGKAQIEVNNGLRNVEMQIMDGFTLLDWGMVIQRATTIHTVCTSINYVLEILDLQAEKIHLYLRLPDEKNYDTISYLLTKNYIFH